MSERPRDALTHFPFANSTKRTSFATDSQGSRPRSNQQFVVHGHWTERGGTLSQSTIPRGHVCRTQKSTSRFIQSIHADFVPWSQSVPFEHSMSTRRVVRSGERETRRKGKNFELIEPPTQNVPSLMQTFTSVVDLIEYHKSEPIYLTSKG